MKKLIVLMLSLTLFLCGCGSVDFEGGGDSGKPIKKMMEAALDCNGEDYLAAFPPQMVKDYNEKQVTAVWFEQATMTDWLKKQKESYSFSYGKDIEIDVEVIKLTEVSMSDVEDMNPDPYTYVSYVTAANTSKVCAVSLEYSIEGSVGEEECTKVIYTVLQDGKWYVHPIHAFDSFGQ